jgi:predicted nucleotidyltransferase
MSQPNTGLVQSLQTRIVNHAKGLGDYNLLEATMGIEELLSENRPAILRAAKAHGAGNVRVFGSVARGEASADSDVDLLVDLEPGRSLLDHAALVIELEALLGRKVDIAIARGLRSRIRDRVLKEAIPL